MKLFRMFLFLALLVPFSALGQDGKPDSESDLTDRANAEALRQFIFLAVLEKESHEVAAELGEFYQERILPAEEYFEPRRQRQLRLYRDWLGGGSAFFTSRNLARALEWMTGRALFGDRFLGRWILPRHNVGLMESSWRRMSSGEGRIYNSGLSLRITTRVLISGTSAYGLSNGESLGSFSGAVVNDLSYDEVRTLVRANSWIDTRMGQISQDMATYFNLESWLISRIKESLLEKIESEAYRTQYDPSAEIEFDILDFVGTLQRGNGEPIVHDRYLGAFKELVEDLEEVDRKAKELEEDRRWGRTAVSLIRGKRELQIEILKLVREAYLFLLKKDDLQISAETRLRVETEISRIAKTLKTFGVIEGDDPVRSSVELKLAEKDLKRVIYVAMFGDSLTKDFNNYTGMGDGGGAFLDTDPSRSSVDSFFEKVAEQHPIFAKEFTRPTSGVAPIHTGIFNAVAERHPIFKAMKGSERFLGMEMKRPKADSPLEWVDPFVLLTDVAPLELQFDRAIEGKLPDIALIETGYNDFALRVKWDTPEVLEESGRQFGIWFAERAKPALEKLVAAAKEKGKKIAIVFFGFGDQRRFYKARKYMLSRNAGDPKAYPGIFQTPGDQLFAEHTEGYGEALDRAGVHINAEIKKMVESIRTTADIQLIYSDALSEVKPRSDHFHPLDGMHLSRLGHSKLGEALYQGAKPAFAHHGIELK